MGFRRTFHVSPWQHDAKVAGLSLAPFDAYRDEASRKLMIEFVARTRIIEAPRAVAELRGLNHVGLAYVYRDALAAAFGASAKAAADYDPCAIAR